MLHHRPVADCLAARGPALNSPLLRVVGASLLVYQVAEAGKFDSPADAGFSSWLVMASRIHRSGGSPVSPAGVRCIRHFSP
jgi:hypothetical protein